MSGRVDLAVVGVGLSGARAIKELIDLLAASQRCFPRPLRVALIDPAGEPGRGVPYGTRSDRRALLIETLEETRCPEFARWIDANRQLLAGMERSSDADDRAWYRRNAAALARGELAQLYLPRHVFGTFSALELEAALERGRARGLLSATTRRAEVIDIEPLSSGYRLRCADGGLLDCGHVLLAVGSIPRGDQFLRALDAGLQHRYISDHTYCGSFRLRDALDEFQRRAPAGPVRLVIIGAAASAIESLYCAMNHPPLSQRIESVITISRSGMLPNGLTGNRGAAPSDYARLRTSADVYVAAARELLEQGRLDIMPALIDSITGEADALRLDVSDTLDARRRQVIADLVINCSGAGDVHTTTSRLLNALGRKLALRRQGRGFLSHVDKSLVQWPRVFLAGPLLNEGDAAKDVESISAAFRAGRELGRALAAALMDDIGTRAEVLTVNSAAGK